MCDAGRVALHVDPEPAEHLERDRLRDGSISARLVLVRVLGKPRVERVPELVRRAAACLAWYSRQVSLYLLVLRNKLWAYLWLIALLAAFIVYRLYRLSSAPRGRSPPEGTGIPLNAEGGIWKRWRER